MESNGQQGKLEEPLLAEESGSSSSKTVSFNDDEGSASMSSLRSTKRASRPSIKDSLGVPEEEMANIELDVYNVSGLCFLLIA